MNEIEREWDNYPSRDRETRKWEEKNIIFSREIDGFEKVGKFARVFGCSVILLTWDVYQGEKQKWDNETREREIVLTKKQKRRKCYDSMRTLRNFPNRNLNSALLGKNKFLSIFPPSLSLTLSSSMIHSTSLPSFHLTICLCTPFLCWKPKLRSFNERETASHKHIIVVLCHLKVRWEWRGKKEWFSFAQSGFRPSICTKTSLSSDRMKEWESERISVGDIRPFIR